MPEDVASPAGEAPLARSAPTDDVGLAGRDFIVFGDNWGRHQSSSQHVFKHVLRGNRVLWVQTIGLRNPSWSLYDLKRSVEILKRFVADTPGDRPVVHNLTVCSPRMLPFSNLAPVRSLNRASVVRAVRAQCRAQQMVDPILVTSVPNAADYLGAFGESLSVYYCLDDFTEWPGAIIGQIRDWEERLLAGCDLTFTTSGVLQTRKTRGARVPHFLGQGVDVEHFAGPVGPRPAGMAQATGPAIGFFGAISPWVDLDLITGIARERPDWAVVIIGPADVDVQPLRAYPNIHLLGKVPYAELPAYARAFDVGIIPFAVNGLTEAVNPLKLLEYLAAGVPVVSTDMPEVRKFAGTDVRIAHGVADFVSAIDSLLPDARLEAARARRRNVAEGHSWRAVATQFCVRLRAALDAPKAHGASHGPAPHRLETRR